MAVVSGMGGTVSAVAVTANVTSWSIDISAESIDTSSLTSTGNYRTRIAGIKDWSGSYVALVDNTALVTFQANIGNVVEDAVFSLVSGSCTGDIVITGVAINATLDSAVECTFSFDGAGVLTLASGS
jgi:predicted secreted protein